MPFDCPIWISVDAPHTGHLSGMENEAGVIFFASMTFGMIILALITCKAVCPFPPIPNRSISLILYNEALDTVVPSISTGSKIATGEMFATAQLHSISRNVDSTGLSSHLKAIPALLIWCPVIVPEAAYIRSS